MHIRTYTYTGLCVPSDRDLPHVALCPYAYSYAHTHIRTYMYMLDICTYLHDKDLPHVTHTIAPSKIFLLQHTKEDYFRFTYIRMRVYMYVCMFVCVIQLHHGNYSSCSIQKIIVLQTRSKSVCMCVCLYVCMCVCACVYVCMYVCMYVCIELI
jgi:hypothetical protein